MMTTATRTKSTATTSPTNPAAATMGAGSSYRLKYRHDSAPNTTGAAAAWTTRVASIDMNAGPIAMIAVQTAHPANQWRRNGQTVVDWAGMVPAGWVMVIALPPT